MEKRLTILFILLLCACQKQKTVACIRYDGADHIDLYLSAAGDDILSIAVDEVFVLPEELLLNEKYLNDLKKQFDSSCRIENDKLIRSYHLPLDDTYSLGKTLEELRKQRYYCE